MIRRFRKRQEIKNKQWDQYKEAIHTLNEELTAIIEKLKEESCLQEEAQKAKAGLVTELLTLHEEMEKARADAMAEFRASQPFIDACTVYYGDGFEDCLKQVRSVYPYLDLSKISLDNLMSAILGGGDIIHEESDDSIHIEEQGPKDDGVVIAQPALDGPVAILIPSAKDPTSQAVKNPSALDAPQT